MDLSQQVVSLDLARRLMELGYPQKSIFCYQPVTDSNPTIWPRAFDWSEFKKPSIDERIAAFTVAELGELLPGWLMGHYLFISHGSSWHVKYLGAGTIPDEKHQEIEGDKLADCLAELLIHLIENKLIDIGEK